MKLSNKLILVFFLLILAAAGVNSQTRGGDLEAAVGPNVAVGKQWAVFIAIDRYQEWGPLKTPVRDAKEIRDILRENYYIDEIRELYDQSATAAGIRQLFTNLSSQVEMNDSVFIYYAGHGYTDHTNTGFWIPSNGGLDTMAQVNWIPNSQIRNMLTQLSAKHIFLVSDSCFSGDLLNQRRGVPVQINSNYYRQAYSKTSLQVMTSGSSEGVPEPSEFSIRLKDGLWRAEGACIDPEYLFTTAGVRDVESTQPLLGAITPYHQEGGSFLFFRKTAAAAQSAPQVTPSPVSQASASAQSPSGSVTAASASGQGASSEREFFIGAWTAAVEYNKSFDTYEINFSANGRFTVKITNDRAEQETTGNWSWDGTLLRLNALFRNARIAYQNNIQWVSVIDFAQDNNSFNILGKTSTNGSPVRFTFFRD